MALDGHWATFFLMTLFVGIEAGLGYRLHDSFHNRLGDFSLGIKIFSCFRFTNDLKDHIKCWFGNLTKSNAQPLKSKFHPMKLNFSIINFLRVLGIGSGSLAIKRYHFLALKKLTCQAQVPFRQELRDIIFLALTRSNGIIGSGLEIDKQSFWGIEGSKN